MRRLINIAFPLKCRICENTLSIKNSTEVCDKCWSDVKIFPPTGCLKCDNTIRYDPSHPIKEESVCIQCREHSNNVDRLSSYGIYEGVLKEAIHLFKYRRNLYTGDRLAILVIKAFKNVFLPENIDFVIPVPLHKNRLRWREFNQSGILANSISQKFDLPVIYDLLERKKKTKSQTDLDVNQRMLNIKGAFTVKNTGKTPLIPRFFSKISNLNYKSPEKLGEGKRILLVDDVLTTGITTNECAKILKDNGAAFVGVVTIAKTLHGQE